MFIFLVLLFCVWNFPAQIPTTTKSGHKLGGFATDCCTPKQIFWSLELSNFFDLFGPLKKGEAWCNQPKAEGIKLFLPKTKHRWLGTTITFPKLCKVTLNWELEYWIFYGVSWYDLVWFMSLVAVCVLIAIYKTYLVTTPGQMVCDIIVLCGHISDRSTTSIIIGKKAIWMASLQVLTAWSDFFISCHSLRCSS